MAARWALLVLAGCGAVVLAACGSSATSSSSTSAAASTPSPTPTPQPTPTPGPASLQATLTGDAKVTGPLTVGSVHFVNCEIPSLDGETIDAFETAADPAVGVLLTLRAGTIDVRLASGSGTSYTERDFSGTGVTGFNAAGGAQFSSPVTESTPAGQNKGTVEAITSIAGSVSCGTFQPGGGSVTLSGSTADGAISGTLAPIRVMCNTAGAGSVTTSGLTHLGSTPASVEIGGGYGGSTFFVSLSTKTGVSHFYQSMATSGLVTVSGSTVTYSATATETSSGATVMVSGTATCGT